MREGILKGKKWANREISKVKVIPGLAERAEFSSAGAAVGGSKQALTASVIGIVSAVGRSVDIKSVTEIGEIEAAAAGVHVNISGRLKIGSGVSIASKAWRQYLTPQAEDCCRPKRICSTHRRLRSRRIQEADKDGIDDLSLLIFLGRVDHVVSDLHGLWKVYRGKLKQSLDTPKSD